MCQLHKCTFLLQQPIKHIDNDDAHVDALGPAQGPEARLPDQGVNACMHLRVAAQCIVQWLENIRIMYAASEAQGQ